MRGAFALADFALRGSSMPLKKFHKGDEVA